MRRLGAALALAAALACSDSPTQPVECEARLAMVPQDSTVTPLFVTDSISYPCEE